MKYFSLFLFSKVMLLCASAHADKNSNVILFVHGAWGGAWDYQNMDDILSQKGFKVYRPTLTGLGEKSHLLNQQVGLHTHIKDIVNVIKYEELSNVILVGHSYGGMVITGVADAVPNNINRLVYADAFVPKSGESAFDLMPDHREFMLNLAKTKGDGWKIPPYWPDWGKDVPHPLLGFTQKLSYREKHLEKIPATYILTFEDSPEDDNFSVSAQRAKAKRWDYFELKTEHNLQRTKPNEYADIIIQHLKY